MRQPENAWGRFQAAFVCGDGDWVECVVIQKVGGCGFAAHYSFH